MNSTRPPTLVDVATAAGVSRGTASNVFTHPERVRQEVRDRVEAVAHELGYAGPDPRGRILRAGRFNALGFVIPGAFGIGNLVESPYGRELIAGIGSACDAAGVALTMIDGRYPELDSALRTILVDGIVVGHIGHLDALEPARRRRLPIAILDVPAGPDIPSVVIDARSGARDAAAHLTSLGHRRFAIVSVRRTPGLAILHPQGIGEDGLADGYQLDRDKLDGYRDALAEHDIDITRVPLIETSPMDAAAGSALLEMAKDATAFLVMSDRQAYTILNELNRRAIRVPDDVSIVGFDGVPDGARWAPGLTTIAQPTREKGRLAAELVLTNAPPQHIVLPTSLLLRGSTAAPRI